MNVQKLQAILLLEANFNTICKIIFNNRLLHSIEVVNAILIEVIGGRRFQLVTYLALDKKLTSNIVNVRKLPAITTYTDATNYYDRVAHPFDSLCTEYLE